MRLLPYALLAIAACGGGQIQNLPLSWRGVGEMPRPSPAVAQSFATAPLMFRLRDLRPDPSAVGRFDDDGFIVRTSDNVGEYCTTKMGTMLANAGARLNEPTATVMLDTELLDYNVVEGGAFNGSVRIRATLRRTGGPVWSKLYMGKSVRWGKTHNPENFNEALSNALEDVTKQLVQDTEFARALAPGQTLSAAPEG